MASSPPCITVRVSNTPHRMWPQLQRQQVPKAAQGLTTVAGETIVDPPIFLPGPTQAVEVDVALIVTVGVKIAMVMDAIGTEKTVTAEIITAIIWIMAGFMMTAMTTAGMTVGVITTVAIEIATVVVDMWDMPIT